MLSIWEHLLHWSSLLILLSFKHCSVDPAVADNPQRVMLHRISGFYLPWPCPRSVFITLPLLSLLGHRKCLGKVTERPQGSVQSAGPLLAFCKPKSFSPNVHWYWRTLYSSLAFETISPSVFLRKIPPILMRKLQELPHSLSCIKVALSSHGFIIIIPLTSM